MSVKIIDVDVRAEPDSGAEVNILDEHQFKALTNRSSVKLTLQPSRVKLGTLQSELPVKEEFTATVRNQTRGAVVRFVVDRGRINSPPLISKSTLQELGMLQIREDGSFAKTNDLRSRKNHQASKVSSRIRISKLKSRKSLINTVTYLKASGRSETSRMEKSSMQSSA